MVIITPSCVAWKDGRLGHGRRDRAVCAQSPSTLLISTEGMADWATEGVVVQSVHGPPPIPDVIHGRGPFLARESYSRRRDLFVCS
jgi:hypothetical protein